MRSMLRGKTGGRGFTLVEMVIVVALLAVLGAVVVPNVVGFMGKGKLESYNSDRDTLQLAVDAYFTDKGTFPTNSGNGLDDPTNGTPANPADDSFIKMSLLTADRYIHDIPRSASSANDPAGTGSYGWYVDSNGRVRSSPVFQEGVYP